MSIKKLLVYDGIKYKELTLKDITKNSNPTGHYEIDSEKIITIYGILDDEKVKETFINELKNHLRVTMRSQNYLITNDDNDKNPKYFYLLSSHIQTKPNELYEADGINQILKIIFSIGYLQSYSLSSQKISLEIKSKTTGNIIKLKLIPFDNEIYSYGNI